MTIWCCHGLSVLYCVAPICRVLVCLNIVLSSSHTGNDVLKAYCQAFHMANTIDNNIVEEKFNFEELESNLQSSGWDTGSLLVINEGWKIKVKNL